MDFSRQCALERKNPDGTMIVHQVTYLPEKFAIVGKPLRLKEDDGTWTDGWVVKEVYQRKETAEVNIRSRDYTRQREASDI